MSKLNFSITSIDDDLKDEIISSFIKYQQPIVAAVLSSGLASAVDLFYDMPFDLSQACVDLLKEKNFAAYNKLISQLGLLTIDFSDSPFFDKDEITDEIHKLILSYSLPYLQALVDDVVEVAESSAFAEYYDQSYSFDDYAREIGDPIINDRMFISNQQRAILS